MQAAGRLGEMQSGVEPLKAKDRFMVHDDAAAGCSGNVVEYNGDV